MTTCKCGSELVIKFELTEGICINCNPKANKSPKLLKRYKKMKKDATKATTQAAPTSSGLTLTKWVHPTTGEVRIYINGLPSSITAKVWFVNLQGMADVKSSSKNHFDYPGYMHNTHGLTPIDAIADEVLGANCLNADDNYKYDWNRVLEMAN